MEYYLSTDVITITLKHIEELIKERQRENSLIDYKWKVSNGLSDIICSFLNNLGGHIVFGIEEEDDLPKKIIGFSSKDISKIHEKIKNIRPQIDLSRYLHEIEIDSNLVVAILFIPRNKNKWFLSKGKFYIRQGDSSNPLMSESEIRIWKNSHPENGSMFNEETLERYYKKLIQKFEKIQFFGLSIEDALKSEPISLSKIYIPACFILKHEYKPEPNDLEVLSNIQAILSDKLNSSVSTSSFQRISEQIYRVDDFDIQLKFIGSLLQVFKRFVVLGKPGFGKSTFLHYLSLVFALRQMKTVLNYNVQLIPFYIELRSYASFVDVRKNNGEPYSIIDFIVYNLQNNFIVSGTLDENKNFVNETLTKGNALILLDAIDEIGNVRNQQEIAFIVQSLTLEYPEVYLIITCRELEYNLISFPKDQFIHMFLMPLRPYSIRKFVSLWYSQIEPDVEIRKNKITSLISKLNSNPILMDLARNHLILSLLSLIANYEAVLPSEQFLLYSKVTKTFLISREVAKELGNSETYFEFEQILARIAFQIQIEVDEGRKSYEITKNELKETLIEYFIHDYGDSKLKAHEKAKSLIEGIISRPIILLPMENSFSFWHRSFQDYYTTLYIRKYLFDLKEAFWNFLEEKISNPQWWEAFHFNVDAINQISRKQANDYAEQLLRLLDEKSVNNTYMAKCITLKHCMNPKIKTICIDYTIKCLKDLEHKGWMSAIYELQFLVSELSEDHIYQIMKTILSNPLQYSETLQINDRLIVNPFMELFKRFYLNNKAKLYKSFVKILEELNLKKEATIIHKIFNEELDLEYVMSLISFIPENHKTIMNWHSFRVLLNKPFNTIRDNFKVLKLNFEELSQSYPPDFFFDIALYYLSIGIELKAVEIGKKWKMASPSSTFSKPIYLGENEKISKESQADNNRMILLKKNHPKITLIGDSVTEYFGKLEPKRSDVKYDTTINDKTISVFALGIQFQIPAFKDISFPLDIGTLNEYYKHTSNELRFRLILTPKIYSLAFRYVFKDNASLQKATEMRSELKKKAAFFNIELIEEEEFYWLRRSVDSFRKKDYEYAIECADKALQLDSTLSNLYRLKAEALANLHRFKKSQNICDDYKRRFKEDKWYHIQSVLNCINTDRFEDANELIIKLESFDMDFSTYEHILVLESKAIALYKTGAGEKAVTIFDRIIKENPKRQQSYRHRALALISLGRSQESIKFMNEAISIFQSESIFLIPLFRAFIENKSLDDVIATYKKMVSNKIETSLFYSISDEEVESQEFLKEWLKRDPDALLPLRTLTENEFRKKNYDLALENIQTLIKKHNDWYAWFLKGSIEKILEREEDSIKSLKRALELNPNLEDVRSKIRFIDEYLGTH